MCVKTVTSFALKPSVYSRARGCQLSPECESRLKKEFGERFDVVCTFHVVSVSLTYINKLTSTIIYQICQTFQLNMFVENQV